MRALVFFFGNHFRRTNLLKDFDQIYRLKLVPFRLRKHILWALLSDGGWWLVMFGIRADLAFSCFLPFGAVQLN